MKRFVFYTAIILSFLIQGCTGSENQGSTLDKVKKRGKLIAGVKIESPPFGFLDDKGNSIGFEIDPDYIEFAEHRIRKGSWQLCPQSSVERVE